jgi:hypothetical protein
MSSRPRDWPNKAAHARDASAEAAIMGIEIMRPLVYNNRPMTEAEIVRRHGIALNQFQEIARLLESVGACTRPKEL